VQVLELFKRSVFSVILFSLLLFIIGCEENPSEATVDPQLYVSKSSLNFGSESTEMTFTIANQGEGTLEWTISSTKNWISCTPDDGATTTETDVVTVTANRDNLSDGSYEGDLLITPNVGSASSIAIQLVVPPPELYISTTNLDFGSTEEELSFTIENIGGGRLTWELYNSHQAIEMIPTSGETSMETDQVRITIDRSSLSAGNYESEISLSSNVGDETISVVWRVGEIIWHHDTVLDDLYTSWECLDDDASSGIDYWGFVLNDEREYAIWCNGLGEHPSNRYDNNMDAWMYLRADMAIDIRPYSDVVIRFWMYYDTELENDYQRFLIRGNDDRWYYNSETTQWSGTNNGWRQYEVSLSDWEHAPTSFLRIGYHFHSDFSVGGEGVFLDDIEVWGIE
jgi:hypothetical protein